MERCHYRDYAVGSLSEYLTVSPPCARRWRTSSSGVRCRLRIRWRWSPDPYDRVFRCRLRASACITARSSLVNSGEKTRSSWPPPRTKSATTRCTDVAKSLCRVEPRPARLTTAASDTGSSMPRLSSRPTPPPFQPIFRSSWLPTLESGIRASSSLPLSTYIQYNTTHSTI